MHGAARPPVVSNAFGGVGDHNMELGILKIFFVTDPKLIGEIW